MHHRRYLFLLYFHLLVPGAKEYLHINKITRRVLRRVSTNLSFFSLMRCRELGRIVKSYFGGLFYGDIILRFLWIFESHFIAKFSRIFFFAVPLFDEFNLDAQVLWKSKLSRNLRFAMLWQIYLLFCWHYLCFRWSIHFVKYSRRARESAGACKKKSLHNYRGRSWTFFFHRQAHGLWLESY